MAKITSGVLVLALFAMAFLNGAEVTARNMPATRDDYLYGTQHWFLPLLPPPLILPLPVPLPLPLPLPLRGPWFGGPWGPLRNGKTLAQVNHGNPRDQSAVGVGAEARAPIHP